MIHQISLNDCLEPCAPPEQVLTISALDDVAFVRVCKVKQDHKSETHTEVAEISVSLPSLLEAVALLAADQERENLRPLDHDGQTKETRIAGRRLAIAAVGPRALVGALTDHLRYSPPPGKPAKAGEPE